MVAARADRANIDAALAWAAAHDPRLGVRIANGFGWTWVVLGDGVAGATRVRGALDAAADVATPRERATGLLLSGWLEASAGNVERADADLDAALGIAEELSDERLRADAQRHLAFLRIQQGRPHDVLAQAGAGLDVYRRLDLRWETAASLLLAAYGSIMLGDTAGATGAADEAVRLLDSDRGLLGAGPRRSDARRDRPGRAPVRRRGALARARPRPSPSGSVSSARPRCT